MEKIPDLQPDLDETIHGDSPREKTPSPAQSIDAAERIEARTFPAPGEKVWVLTPFGKLQEATVQTILNGPTATETKVPVYWEGEKKELIKQLPLVGDVIFVGREFALDDPRTGNRGGIVESIDEKNESALINSPAEKYRRPLETLLAPILEKNEQADSAEFRPTPEQEALVKELWPNGINEKLTQQEWGDCYYLSGLNTIKNADDAMESVLRVISKNTDDTFNVRFPGDEVAGRTFLITRSNVIEAEGLGVKGSLGDKILERAYARLRDKRKSDSDSEHATARTVLHKPEEIAQTAINGGDALDALKDLLGSTHEYTRPPRDFISRVLKSNLADDPKFIESGKIKIVLSIAGEEGPKKIVQDASRNEVELPEHHAYALIGTFPTGAGIVEDPHGKRYEFTFDQIGKIFDDMGVATKKTK